MRLKDLVSINQRTLPETTRPDYAFRYVEISSVDSNGTIQNLEEMTFDSAPSRARRLVKRDDVIVSTVRTYLRAIGAIDSEATDIVVSTGFAVCTPNEKVVPKYLNYALRSDNVMDEICKDSSGISYPAINATKLSSIEIPYWDIPLQRAIVAYLDEKTAAIDGKVALLEKKLAAFKRLKASVINRAVTRGLDPKAKLKDSGVDWIGKIPVGWETRRVKDVGAAWNGLTYSPEDVCGEDNGVLVLRSSNIQEGRLDYTDCVYVNCDVPNLARVKRGDVLICSRNGSAALVGKNVLIEDDVSAAFGAFMLVFRGDHKNENRYSHYVFNAQMFESYMGGFATSTIHQLLRSDFLNMEMPYPPSIEQIAIADYLDAECAMIDKAAAVAEKQIDAYRRLKRSLINEVVTGKRKVA